MRTLTLSSLVILGFIVVGLFVTSTSLTQLSIAIILYPILVFIAYKVFLSKKQTTSEYESVNTADTEDEAYNEEDSYSEDFVQEEEIKQKSNDDHIINDKNKRLFLKILGATGISFFLISIFGKRIGSLFLNNTQESSNQPTPTPSPTDGYNISEIEDNATSYYGYTNKDGKWYIMKGDEGTFRYVKGNSGFATNWERREDLKYKYFHEVFK